MTRGGKKYRRVLAFWKYMSEFFKEILCKNVPEILLWNAKA